MGRKGPVIVLAALGLAVGFGFVLHADSTGLPFLAQHKATPAPPPPQDSDAGASPARPAQSKKSVNPPADNPLRFMLASVADKYQTNSRYPAYSVPLTRSQAQAYAGNHYEPTTLPLRGGGQFTVTLEQYRFTRGDDILVVASVSGPMVVGLSATAHLRSMETGENAASVKLESPEDGVFQGVLDSDQEPGEYRLVVEARIDGKPLRHVSTLTIEPDLGEFGSVESTRIENNNLVIPVEFDAKDSGTFALSANLFANGQPVAHLNREVHLDGSKDVIELKAHGSVLAGKVQQGQMTLKGLQLRRLPKRPGDRTAFAFGPEDGFDFEAPDLDQLKNTSARTPESEQRAALLRKLSYGV